MSGGGQGQLGPFDSRILAALSRFLLFVFQVEAALLSAMISSLFSHSYNKVDISPSRALLFSLRLT